MFDETWFRDLLQQNASQEAKKSTRPLKIKDEHVISAPRIDWGDAPDVSQIFGREKEIADIKQRLQPGGVVSQVVKTVDTAIQPGGVVSQAIGTVGVSGRATGPHLHWETRFAGVAVRPRTDRDLVDKGAAFRIIAACLSQRR